MVPATTSVRARRALTSFLLLVAVCNRASAGPTVNKLEPPNWWVGLPSPMLLISGDGLSEAKVSTESADVKVIRVQVEGTGHYLFVWLDTGRARPETVNLILQTPEASTTLQFPLQARKNTSDGFQGFGEDDVIYLIMPDRFADGDPGNNRPSGSKARYDRTQAKA